MKCLQKVSRCSGDPKLFSKRAIFERILREEGVPGSQLLSSLRDTRGGERAETADEDGLVFAIELLSHRVIVSAGRTRLLGDLRTRTATADRYPTPDVCT